MKQELCPFCHERPATLLCDFVIGFEWDGELSKAERYYSVRTGEYEYTSEGGIRYIAKDAEMFTCDRLICAECATNKGFIHYKGKPSVSGFDSIDRCPQCRDSEEDSCVPLTKEEANAKRKQMWARSSGMLRLQACL